MHPKCVATTLAVTVLALGAVSPVLAQNAEYEAIKAVIRAEADAYFGRDADAWQATWLHDSQSTRTLLSSNSYNAKAGWENFGPQTVEYLRENPEPLVFEMIAENYLIHTDGNSGWAEFDEKLTIPSMNYSVSTREHRRLVKNDGQWKIASQMTINTGSYESSPEAIEARLNATGDKLLAVQKVSEAIEVFKLNTQLHPDSWRAYDSLGEAYALAGNTALAIQNYERSLQLNPESESGKLALAKLRP